MNWSFWKQNRWQLLTASCILLIYAIFTIYTGRHNLYFDKAQDYFPNQAWVNIVRATFGMPILLGMFFGAPLLSKGYSEGRGTNKLVWTQGISRRRWLTVTLGLALLFAILYGLAFSLLTSWWISTVNHSGLAPLDRFEFPQFDITGLAPVLHAMFGVAVGAVLGVWLRRPLPALDTTLILLCILTICVGKYVRP